MDKTITRFDSLKAMKSDEYRPARLPGRDRIRAVMDLNLDLYAMKRQAVMHQDFKECCQPQRRTG